MLSSHDKLKFVCTECKSEYITYIFNFIKPVCPRCKRKEALKFVDWAARNKKSEQTKLHRYGNPKYVNPAKGAATKEFRYGDPHYNNKEKTKYTNLARYGTKSTFQAEPIKTKIKNTCIERYGGMGTSSDLIRQKIKSTNKKKYGCEYSFQAEAVKEKIKNTCLNRYGVPNGGISCVARQKTHKKYLYNNINFDSSWEIALYIYLRDNNIEFEYQPDISFKYYYNGEEHLYYPDFKIKNEYIEIKGDHFFKNGTMINPFNTEDDYLYNEKYKCMLQNNIKILKNNEMIVYIDYVNKKYGAKYIENFKRKH